MENNIDKSFQNNDEFIIKIILPLMEDTFKDYYFLKLDNIQKTKMILYVMNNCNDYSLDNYNNLKLQLKNFLFKYTMRCLDSKRESAIVINNYLSFLQPVNSYEAAKENLYSLKGFLNKYNHELGVMIIKNLLSQGEAFESIVKYFINENDNSDSLVKFVCNIYYEKINDDMLNDNYYNNSRKNDKMILKEIGRIPLLSIEEEKRLILEYKNNGSIEARDKIIISNMRIVADIARKKIGGGIPLEDMIQEGCLGLVEALNRFDITKNIKFGTYAYYWVKQSIIRFIKSKSRIIRVPEYMYSPLMKFKKAKKLLENKLMRDVSIEDIAEYLNIPIKKAYEFHQYLSKPISLNLAFWDDDDDDKIEDHYESDLSLPEEEMCVNDIANVIERIMSDAKLTEKQKKVLYLRFGFKGRIYTQPEIARIMNVTPQNINCIEKYAIMKMQKVKNIEEHRIYLEGR